jgi:DNA-binding NarL/FixJ family response regulator
VGVAASAHVKHVLSLKGLGERVRSCRACNRVSDETERIAVVICDDSAPVRAAVRATLQLHGRIDVVAEGKDGVEAIALAAAHRPGVMVLDVIMPVLDGLSALPQIRAASPETRVVMYSSAPPEPTRTAALRSGASQFVEKTGDPAELLRAITEAPGA